MMFKVGDRVKLKDKEHNYIGTIKVLHESVALATIKWDTMPYLEGWYVKHLVKVGAMNLPGDAIERKQCV